MNELLEARQRASQMMARLSIVAEAPAANPGGTGGGKPGSKHLLGTLPERARTHDHWRKRFLQAWNNAHDLNKEVDEAEQELHDLQHGPPPEKRTEETADQLFTRIGKESAGWSIAEAAVHFRTTHRTVIEARKAADCDTIDGTKLVVRGEMTDEQRLAEARRLKALGASYKSIAPRIGLTSGEGVRQMLKRAA